MLVRKEKFVMNEDNNSCQITKDILKDYYACVRCCAEHYFSQPMKEFKEKHPKEFARLSAVHHKRFALNKNVAVLKELDEKIYFGTLTFNDKKDKNKIQTKRKEAFKRLNDLFEFVVLIEEEGSMNGRYHIHFLGNFKEGKSFKDFKKLWHSRQNLRELRQNENISQYLCKYMSKQLPRIRRNKRMIELERKVSRVKPLKRSFPKLYQKHVNESIFLISAFD